MSDRVTVEVPAELDRVRIDRVLAVLAEVSRSVSRRMLEAEMVSVAGVPATMATVPHSGDLVEYQVLEKEEPLLPEAIPFEVAYESTGVIVVDKPAGLVVHPGAGNTRGTLAGGLIHRYPELERLGTEHRWGLVHRLDRDTSGLLLVARSSEMHAYLQGELKERKIGRTYLALVSGSLQAATGTIDAPIGRDPLRPTRMALVHDGRPSRTHYRRLAEWEECALVEVQLETGRTHQIRVHFASIGNSLAGDATYGRGVPVPGDPGRVWLHATKLRFTLPDGEAHEIASDLPSDLVQSLRALGEPEIGEVAI